jgi:radical SAM protein with 4Fe4S-binding SPASM domain
VTTQQWLDKYDLDEFLRLFTWVGVSITLSGREAYQKFFGVDKYDQALKNLKTLLLKIQKERLVFSVGISLKPTEQSSSEILSHPDFNEINELVQGTLTRQVKKRSYFVDDWQGAVKLPPYLKKRPIYPRSFRPCAILYDKLMVFSNGKVSACSCRDFEADSELIIGNIKTDCIHDLWNGEKLHEIRSNWRSSNKIPKICKSCRHYVY